MKELIWRNETLPVSSRFDDPYYSVEDGQLETRYVFVEGNKLPDRWADMSVCTIAELGFGTGLNFLETVSQWRRFKVDGASLRFHSFEQYPLSRSDMTRALGAWPELATDTKALLEIWKPERNCFQASFSDNVSLEVYFGDANANLPKANFVADAWYLDGFSPAKNPQLWNESLMMEVGKHCVAQGTFATYTAAGFVRRNLQKAGFVANKIKGFGRKREMLVGMKQNDIDVVD